MKAVGITQFGTPDVLKIIETNKPSISENEVLINVKAAGINRPDIVQRQGFYPAPKGASEILGLEVAGVIVEIGSNVTKHKIGDEVCALLPGGGYAEFASCHENLALPIPTGLNFIEAASIPETYFTVWSNLFDQCSFKKNDIVLIHGGTSGIGVCAIQLVKAFNGTAIITAGSEEKCLFAKTLGTDFAINYKEQDFVAQTLEFTQNKGANIILDIIGGSYVNRNFKAVANLGKICQIAFLESNLAQINLNYVMRKKLTLTGSTLRAQNIEFKSAIASNLIEKIWPLFENKTIKPIIDQVFPIEKIRDAHKYMESSKHRGKIILDLKNS